MFNILLGSASPRRREMLTEMGWLRKALSPEVVEDYPHDAAPEQGCMLLAERKFSALSAHWHWPSAFAHGAALVTADTLVFLGHTPLGKPQSEAEAYDMLKRLSGQTHRVVTGYVVHGTFGHCCEAVTTLVSFRKLSQEEIQKYIATGEPFGKAGAYAIQGQARNFVDHIYGSLTNVIGLPLKEIQHALHLCTFLPKAEKGT